MSGRGDKLEWLAASDQLAHARRGKEPRTLCGKPRVDPRLAWPPVAKCPDCRMAAGEQGVAA